MPNIFKNIMAAWWLKVEAATPTLRNLDIAYVPLYKKVHGRQAFVGSFLPEFYELANTSQGSLRIQIEERAWINKRKALNLSCKASDLKAHQPELYAALYREVGRAKIRKSPFELAILPSKNIHFIGYAVEKEYKYRRDQKLPLPVAVSKLRVIPDYLNNLAESGLELKTSMAVGIKININNPINKATSREKIIHYIAQWASWLVSISAALAVVDVVALTGGASISILSIFAAATYLSKRCGNDFSTYDAAEALHRDIGWLLSKDLSVGKKISFRKSLETLIYLASASVAMYVGAILAFAGTLALPWSLLPAVSVLEVVKCGAASFFGIVGGLSAWASVTFTQRFFWGLSFWDNQIDIPKKVANALRPIPNTKLVNVNDKKTQNLPPNHTKPVLYREQIQSVNDELQNVKVVYITTRSKHLIQH
ncbi:MAG: hypothetical protein HYX61_01390 [Gammaproteobacteria bacterium]|nr:hypothetical protein [Gammaproteobacteria bacterium]